MLHLILTVFALACFLLAALNVNAKQISFGWLGAFFLTITLVV